MFRNHSRKLSPVLLLCLLSFGCGGEKKSKKARNPRTNSTLIAEGQGVNKRTAPGQGAAPATKNDFYEGEEDSPAMVRAFFEARARIKDFVEALKKPKPSYGAFALKVRLTKNKVSEDIWLSDVVDHGDSMIGKLDNVPKQVKGFEMGQEVRVYKDDILDWMYVDDKVLRGGFTIRVLGDAMSPQKRAEFESSLPWRITKRRR